MQRIARILMLVALATVMTGGSSSAATNSDPVGFVPATSTAAEIEAAERLEPKLAGLSAIEPPICADVFEPVRKSDPATAGAGSITVSPASTEMQNLEPSKRYAYCLVVHNRTEAARTYEFSTIDLAGSPDPDQQQEVIDPPKALGTWVRPALTRFSLEPGERITIPYLLDVPADLPQGTINAAVRITQLPDGETPTSGTIIRPTVQHRLHVTMPGGVAKPLKVSELKAPRLLSHNDDPLAYRAKFIVTNEGTVIDSYETELEVRGFGRKVGSAKVPTAMILPGGANRVALVWHKLPWIGIYHPTATVKGRGGDVDVQLPWLLILPSTPWLIAIAVAILLPLLVLFVRWRRSRDDWRQYLDDEEFDEGDEDAWDDAAQW